MSHHQFHPPPRRILTPGALRKRKEMEPLYPPPPPPPPQPKPSTPSYRSAEPQLPSSSSTSRLVLAGYMAHEYLTKGTLFGQKYDPALAKAVPLSKTSSSSTKPALSRSRKAEQKEIVVNHHSYAEVANLLKGDGPHIPEVFNPAQLARWIQM